MAHLYYFLLDWNISAYIEMNRAGNLMIEVMNDTSLIHEKCIYTSYINGISMARKLNQRHNLLFNLYSELRYSEQEKVFDSFKNSLYIHYIIHAI